MSIQGVGPKPALQLREWSKTMVFVPRESVDHLAGTSQFATKDGDLYERGRNGVIRSMHSKPMRKKDRVRLREGSVIMASMDVTIPMMKVSKNIQATINVTGMKRFNVRLQLMFVLLRLAAWVSPVDTRIDAEVER